MRIKKIKQIDIKVEKYCCSIMEQELKNRLIFSLHNDGISIYKSWSSEVSPYLRIGFCPWCGEKIEIKGKIKMIEKIKEINNG